MTGRLGLFWPAIDGRVPGLAGRGGRSSHDRAGRRHRSRLASVIIGARNEVQLCDNLGAIGWSLTTEQLARLNAASDVMSAYPYYPYRTQQGFAPLNPPPV